MAVLTITPANVKAGSDAKMRTGVAGEAITAGKLVYLNSTTNKVMLVDSNSATAEARVPLGIALNGASLDQPVSYQVSGDITIGAAVSNGVSYHTADTPGDIDVFGGLGGGEYPVLIGIGKSATVIRIGIIVSGTAL